MAKPYDVASRLAEGRPAVDDVAEYVAACHRLGYQHPDLTAYATQVCDWYAGEEGMDLRALDADCAVLSAVAAAAEDAARTQNGLVAELSGAWSGRGAGAAHEFSWRSGQSANAVGGAIRAAADAAVTLRDALWHAVDAKVTAVVDIDGRHEVQRAEWLAAARAVTNGAGDLATASELVDQQVKPFVEGDVCSDWLGAMRIATASIAGAYDTALTATTAAPGAVFAVPGELGPRVHVPEPVRIQQDSDGRPPVQTVPAAAVSSAPAPAAVIPTPTGPPATSWTGATAPAAPAPLADLAAQTPAASMPAAAPSAPPLGDLGGGTSSLGTGLSGFGQQLADLIGGLVGSTGALDGADEPLDDDVHGADERDVDGADERDVDDGNTPETDDEDDPVDPEPAEPPPEETVDTGVTTAGCDPATPGDPAPEVPPAPAAVAPQPDPPPPPQAIPEAVAADVEPTPCEIAAEELPQVGE